MMRRRTAAEWSCVEIARKDCGSYAGGPKVTSLFSWLSAKVLLQVCKRTTQTLRSPNKVVKVENVLYLSKNTAA